MIEHTCIIWKNVLSQKIPACLWVMACQFLPGLARSLADINLRQRTFMPLKTALMGHLTWFLQVNKCFIPFAQGCCKFKSQKIFYFDQGIVQKLKLDNLINRPSRKKKSETDMLSWFFLNFLDDYYSACTYLQLSCFKVDGCLNSLTWFRLDLDRNKLGLNQV